MDSILSFEPFLNQFFFLFSHLDHFGFFPVFNFLPLFNDVLLHFVHILGVNFQNIGILVDNLPFNVPLVSFGNLHDDFFAELGHFY